MDLLSQIFEGESSSGKSGGASFVGQSMRERCAKDLELFCRHYFPDVFTSEFCDFHRDVFQKVQGYILDEDYESLKKYMTRAAPRGHGKSQIISMGLPLWCICYGYRWNILIVSDTAEQAGQFITDIKTQLEDNKELIDDFGNLVGRKTWKADRIVTSNGIHCIGKGAGQKLRGIKYNNRRPDLIIIDDLENDENVETETQRRKLFNWFLKALLKCGYTNTIFIYIGTILHYESLLYKVLHDKEFAMWDRKIYKAVYEFSNSAHWDTWEGIITNLSLDNPAEQAYKYYQKHKKTMLKGVKCLWPEKEEDYYYNLMVERVMDEDSFNSEQQNDPMTEDSRIFKEEWLNKNTYETLPEITEVYYSVDYSMGKSRRADTSAIICLGKGIDNYYYVLHADIKRRNPDIVIDDIIMHIFQYYDKLKKFAVETDVFLEFLAGVMKERLMDKGFYVDWVELKQQARGDKDYRIKSLVPKIKNGYIKFHKSQLVLINQLKNYPKGKVDGIDALEMVVSVAFPSITGASFCVDSIGSSSLRKTQEYNLNLLMKRRW